MHSISVRCTSLLTMLIALLVSFVGTGCSRDLSREKAKALLDKALVTHPGGYVFLNPWSPTSEVLACFERQELWSRRSAFGNVGREVLNLSTGVNRDGTLTLGIKDLVRRQIIDVTGIRVSSESERVVEFTFRWSQNDIPPPLQRCIHIDQEGPFTTTAILRKYDDGWRVAEISNR